MLNLVYKAGNAYTTTFVFKGIFLYISAYFFPPSLLMNCAFCCNMCYICDNPIASVCQMSTSLVCMSPNLCFVLVER
ncbi:hypothetical protein GDO78_003792 [Eleutherodactylus coqui]|uniref:Uncharacterized protein n=1 Tax=Eleutherodactylus coqui TaxID=57060 RepID=A0A8J6EVA4_ELECQ|nr:hypothetical protein GDO78_003792 [Eleutherodactylus coqui]